MNLLEVIGLGLVFIVSCSFGVSKSMCLKQNADRIYSLIRAFETLGEYIRLGQGELYPLMKKSFPEELVSVEDKKFYVNQTVLKKETVKFLQEFLSTVGMQDKKAEYERTLFYKRLLEKQYEDALKTYKEQGRLYNILGVLGGLFLIIFFV